MPRLVETKEPRPEHSTVINWTVPVYIKNGEDYYKVCFDIKRKPLPDGTLPMTDQELEEFGEIVKDRGVYRVWIDENDVACYKFKKGIYHMNGNAVKIKAILWLTERFELTSNN